ncbi:MAG TPA: cytochrome c [Stellaceae bacterium]|nr:cytochrome c [Stellaceae bacterium]
MKLFVPVAAAILATCVAAAAFAQKAAAPTGDVKKGEALFTSIGCWECHGSQGQGGALSGPKIAATMLPYDAFLQQLRTPQNEMPPYEPKILSDQDAANLYAYIKSLPPAQAASAIPELKNLN